MQKRLFFIAIILLSTAFLVSCKGDDKAKENEKIEVRKATKIQEADEQIYNLVSLGFTTEDLVKNRNEDQAEMKDSDPIEQINARNGEFKHDINDGMILEGIVNETTNKVVRLSIVKKDVESDNLSSTLDKYEDTIAAFFLLVAVTNTEEAVKEEDIGVTTYKRSEE